MEPMGDMYLPALIFKYRNDPGYREAISQLMELAEKQYKADAKNLLEKYQQHSATEIYEDVKRNPPSAYVIAEVIRLAMEMQKKATAASGANVTHKENRAMKADVFKWLDDNFTNFKSMDSVAEAIAGKVVPQTFRTVRGWVTEWKKLRSASTP